MEYKSLPYLGNDVALDGLQRFALPMHRYGCRFSESNNNPYYLGMRVGLNGIQILALSR
jgi:hypothetical protein